LVFSSDRGAVTAEFMLITPALILAVAMLLGLFPLGLGAIRLEVEAMQIARLHGYGLDVSVPEGYQFEILSRGRTECIQLRNVTLMESEYCVIPLG
jgi:hypothetical protein